MAGSGGKRGVLTLGGKGNSLSPASIFEFSKKQRSPPLIKIDSSALAKLSATSSSGEGTFRFSIPDYLTPAETRACLLVLVNKLVILSSSPSVEAAAAAAASSHLLNALNNHDFNTTTTTIGDIDEQVHQVLNNCWLDAALLGISSLLDCESFALSTLADAVASLSCEALRADVSSFNSFTDSGDGTSAKDTAAVASDLKVLLNGSKLVGTLRSPQISNIPRIHGCLRSIARSVHSATRVDLNSAGGAGEDLVSVLSSLALGLQNLGKTSWNRSKLCFDSLSADNTTNEFVSGLVDSFNAHCPTIRNLDDSVNSFLTAYLENDYVRSLHLIHGISDLVRKILSWEATASFVILEVIDLIASSVDPNETGEVNPITEKKKKKDKKKKVMGKGTAVLIQFIKDILQFEKKTAEEVKQQRLADDFLSLFDIEDPGFESLLQKVKDIVYSNESRRLPKLPKGTRDFAKEQMAVRERAFTIIGNVFKRHGAMALDTPVFELRETLTEKYGEDSKLIYDLADQGGELCSLRYDLTVPFARYVAMNGLTSFKRYQIAKVYRRDNPSKGRYREFYQCDFDIAGDGTVSADFEVVKILTELLDELKIGDYEIKLNHRKLLDGMLDICGVPSDKVRTISSSIDKLDKQPFEQIKREMVDEKGLSVEAADKIGCFVKQRGHPLKLLSELKKEGSEFLKNIASSVALKDLEKLFEALDKARCLDKVVLDLSLARGLDYYTGVVFEAITKGATQIGSIAAGGRYDNLIGTFGTKHVPAIGVSLGIERVFTIMEQLQKDQNQVVRANETQVVVSILKEDDIPLAAEMVSQCWEAKLKAEFMVHKRLQKHFERYKDSGIPWMVIVGDREIEQGLVRIKDMVANKEDAVPRSKFVEELVKRVTDGMSS